MVRVLSIVLLAVLLTGSLALFDRDTREAISYKLDPSAEKALALGQKHFDSRRGDLYDIDRASSYLEEAYALDPDHPTLNHEMARIAFLRGDFDKAMQFIDREIELQGEAFPNAFYIRGLIEGYMGDYHAAALDYAVYLAHDPTNWAAINDYAWVLLKAHRIEDALLATERGLVHFPQNPWLLNSEAIALYELGRYEESMQSAALAAGAAEQVTPEIWLRAYPGNDPATAEAGIKSLREAIINNIHMAALTLAHGAVQ